MKIYVVGSSKNKFLQLDNIREKFLIDQPHEGDNIDFLNPWYCELTGLYYLWKHVDDDIVGLEHYRRYFVNDNGNLLSEYEIREILKDHDVICNKYTYPKNMKPMTYLIANKTTKSYIGVFVNYIKDIKLRDYLIYRLNNATNFCACNMFISKKDVIDNYMTWLFDILIEIPAKDFYNKPRVIGYMAEFLFGFWLEYNGYKIAYETVYCFNNDLNKIYQVNYK